VSAEAASPGAGVVDADSAASTLAAPDKGAGAPGAAGIAAGVPAPRAAAPAAVRIEEAEPLDLLDLAGGSIYKRLIPVAVGVVVAGAVIAWLVTRR
jgi:hypothetical protein